MLQNSFLASNYRIELGFKDGKFDNMIYISPLDAKRPHPLTITPASTDFVEAKEQIESSKKDSIFNQADAVSIELDVYSLDAKTDKAFLGMNDLPEDSMGSYITTLSKSYFGEPLWFNLNALMNNKSSYSDTFLDAYNRCDLDAHNWCDAGTANAYRFIARRFDGVNRQPFYISPILYNITGYDRTLAKNDLSPYVLRVEAPYPNIQPLTKQPELTHIEGQKQYFNFILSDADHSNTDSGIFLALQYRFYTQSRVFIDTVTGHLVAKNTLPVVSTIALDIEGAMKELKTEKTVGRVEVSLVKVSGDDTSTLSKPLTFRILPASLYKGKVKSFAFLNSLGGWSSFSFGGDSQSEFKTTSDTFFKTHTPDLEAYSSIESVFAKEVKESMTVKTLPIDRQTAEWLKEMSTSTAVYELATDTAESRYIVVEEMKINPNSKDDLFFVEMKYRYSDSYNAK